MYWGALFGATLIMALVALLKAVVPLVLPGASGEHELILYGVCLIVVMIWLPDGIAGLPVPRSRQRARPCAEPTASASPAPRGS